MTRIIGLVVVLVIAGCEKSGKCRRDAEELGQFLRTATRDNPPPPSKIDGKLAALAKLDPIERASELAAFATDIVDDCDAMTKPFVNHGSADGPSRTERLLDELPDDLISCNCRVDLPSLRSFLWYVIARD